MDGLLFSLVNADNPAEVVAWGMEIAFDVRDAEHRVAIVYRCDPYSMQETHSRHGSAEAAREAYGRSLPIGVELTWQDAGL